MWTSLEAPLSECILQPLSPLSPPLASLSPHLSNVHLSEETGCFEQGLTFRTALKCNAVSPCANFNCCECHGGVREAQECRQPISTEKGPRGKMKGYGHAQKYCPRWRKCGNKFGEALVGIRESEPQVILSSGEAEPKVVRGWSWSKLMESPQ